MNVRLPIPSLDGTCTTRLTFRRPVVGDAEWWMEYINDAEAIRFMPFTLGNRADADLFVQRSLERIARDGSCLNVITPEATGRPAGMVGLLTQDVGGVLELEVGYHLLPSAWGQGYATEAATACMEFARTHALASSIISLIAPENHRSQAVAKRNGLHLEKRAMHRGTEALVFRKEF